MASDIEITSLTATPAVGGFALFAEWAPPAVQASLPYMQAASVVFYASATNDFGAATVVGESPAVGLVQVGGVGNGVTRYVWAGAKDPAGNLGDRFPAGGGVAVTTLTTAPGANSVGPSELQNGAVQDRHVVSFSASKILAGVISALIEILGPTITGGLIRTGTGSTRVEMNGANNRLDVYQVGTLVGRLGGTGTGNPVLSISGPTAGVNVDISSAGAEAGYFRNTFGGSGSHGLRALGATTTSPGGHGLVGVSAPGGGWAFYAQVGNYGPFTGAHDALLPVLDAVEIGEIVCSTGRVIARSGVDDALLEVEVSSREKQRGAYGVVSRIGEFDPYGPIAALPAVRPEDPPTPIRLWIAATYQRLSVNGCGEGMVLVCGRGGDIAVGDYICTSAMAGKGQRQNDDTGAADDLLRRHTVAQATQSVTFDHADEVRLVSVIYKCG